MENVLSRTGQGDSVTGVCRYWPGEPVKTEDTVKIHSKARGPNNQISRAHQVHLLQGPRDQPRRSACLEERR